VCVFAPDESNGLWICLFSFWNVPACSFYSFKEVQGDKMFVGSVILVEEGARGLGRALSGGGVVCTVEPWCWYCWYYRYMPRYAHHCDLYLLLHGMLFDLHSDMGWVEQRQ
jgi:hypothetical protein